MKSWWWWKLLYTPSSLGLIGAKGLGHVETSLDLMLKVHGSCNHDQKSEVRANGGSYHLHHMLQVFLMELNQFVSYFVI